MRILFCGLSGIPNKASASINRYLAIGQALSTNNEIIYINRFPLYRKNDTHSNENYGFQIIDATNTKYRPTSFIKRNFLKLTSIIYEFNIIRKLNKEKRIDWLNIYTQYFSIFFFYFIFSKILGFKTVLHYVELRSGFTDRTFLYKINDILYDKYAIKLCDKIIPISTTLNEHVLIKKPDASTLIIPPICDFDYFSTIHTEKTDKKYFVFCSSISYEEVILFTIQSFLAMRNNKDITLHLVINGKIENNIIIDLLKENKDKISLFSNLKYENLIAKYKGSISAIVPLRNTLQDNARFPQKICEFLASERPIVTTSYGEINKYFSDKINAIVAVEYDIEKFAHQLDWVIDYPEDLKAISIKSYDTGRNYFDIKSYNSKMNQFLLQ